MFSAPVFPTNWYMKPPNGGPGKIMVILSIVLDIDEDDVAYDMMMRTMVRMMVLIRW